MDSWPGLAIVIPTYNRKDILLGTVHHLFDNLYYVGDRRYFIADDGSDDGTQEACSHLCDSQIVQSNRVGLGANTNAGLKEAFKYSPFVLQLQDDMWLTMTLDLHPHIEKLATDATAGYIRLWGIGGHKYLATLEGNFWRISWDSSELYIASDRPHVKHKRFHTECGMYPEGLKTADTEEAWCHQTKNVRNHHVDVLVPQMETERSWEHMGWGVRWRDRGL